jgi:hypothetical protein
VCDGGQASDLFWALRGAGHGTFGVVISLDFRTGPERELDFSPWGGA